jgi:2-oxoglutarate ferredoxin oxidoreductase subunit alpha
VEETYTLTIRAFELTERFRTPVILLSDEVVAHMREKVVISERKPCSQNEPEARSAERYIPYDLSHGNVPPFISFGQGVRYNITGLYHDPMGFPTLRHDEVGALMDRLKRKIDDNVDAIVQFETDIRDEDEVVILAYGNTARAARHAMVEARKAGQKVGFMKLLTLWPFPEKSVKAISESVKAIVVPEMNQGQMRLEVERAVSGACDVVGVNKVDGSLVTPAEIFQAVGRIVEL